MIIKNTSTLDQMKELEIRYEMLKHQHDITKSSVHQAKLLYWMQLVNEKIVSLGFQLTRKTS